MAPDRFLGESTNLRLVRIRLFLALVTMFAIPIAIAAPMVYGLAWGFGGSLVVPTLGLVCLALLLGTLTVWLAHRVLEPAERLEEARRILEDAYDRARAEALRDTLTGLGNHRAFQEEMERQWATAIRQQQPLALALVDLDDFKLINDSRGHAVGDGVLRHAGMTIATYLRRSDRAFRIGGDEFAIIMPGTDAERAHATIRRLLAACLDDGGNVRDSTAVSFSAGISEIPGQAQDRGSLYTQADAALFWGKHHGRTCVTIYDSERHDVPIGSRPAAEVSALVARVAATGAIRAVFQPIYDLTTGVPRGFEGLIRPLPDSGFSDAGSMFEAAEATGRTAELDIACLNTVMETAARLRLPGSLAVNLSPRTLETDEFSIHALLRMIARHGLDPRHIVLELTEREAVEDVGRLRRAVDACRVAGIRVAADDVGAGNAGLRLLSQLRFDIVKIDLSLVQGGALHAASLEVVRTLRDLADRWNAGRRRGDRDPRPARYRARARDRCRSGLPARAPDGPTVDRTARPREPQPQRGLAHRASAGHAGMSADGQPGPDHRSRLTRGRSLLDCRHAAGSVQPTHVENVLGWFESGARRRVAIVMTSDGRRVHVPIDPAGPFDVSLLDILRSLPGLGGLLGLITGSRRDRGTRRDERH